MTCLAARAADGGGESTYVLLDPPLSFFSELGTTVIFAGGAETPRMTLTIPANPVAPEQEYLFERVDP